VSVDNLTATASARHSMTANDENEEFGNIAEGGSAVRRRTGTNLRDAYAEHGSAVQEGSKESGIETSPPPR
jgi:hypothetical protein